MLVELTLATLGALVLDIFDGVLELLVKGLSVGEAQPADELLDFLLVSLASFGKFLPPLLGTTSSAVGRAFCLRVLNGVSHGLGQQFLVVGGDVDLGSA